MLSKGHSLQVVLAPLGERLSLSGGEHEGEGWQWAPLLQMGQISRSTPITTVSLCTHYCTHHEVKDILMYWVGSGENLVNKNV